MKKFSFLKPPIAVGMDVDFEDDAGMQRGVVKSIKRNIANAEPYALVEVKHDLPESLLKPVPLSQLRTKA
jgi:hypothetical protein